MRLEMRRILKQQRLCVRGVDVQLHSPSRFANGGRKPLTQLWQYKAAHVRATRELERLEPLRLLLCTWRLLRAVDAAESKRIAAYGQVDVLRETINQSPGLR